MVNSEANQIINTEQVRKLLEKTQITQEVKDRLLNNLGKLTETEKGEIVTWLRMLELVDAQNEFFAKLPEDLTEEQMEEEYKKFQNQLLEKYQKQAEEEKIEKIREELKEGS